MQYNTYLVQKPVNALGFMAAVRNSMKKFMNKEATCLLLEIITSNVCIYIYINKALLHVS